MREENEELRADLAEVRAMKQNEVRELRGRNAELQNQLTKLRDSGPQAAPLEKAPVCGTVMGIRMTPPPNISTA